MNKKNFIFAQIVIFLFAEGMAFSAENQLMSPEIGFSSLLMEMVDRESLARLPEPGYSCRQFSSYDRESDTPGSATWWANNDRSYFIVVEEKHGRKEYVMMDVDGPGAVVRFWATWHGPGGGPFSNGTLRIYLDRQEKPTVEGPLEDVIDRGMLAGPPLSQGVSPLTKYEQRGHDLYLPIPYAKHCKITYETAVLMDEGAKRGEALYYQINYRTYDKTVKVRTFSMADLKASQALLGRTQRMLACNERPGSNLVAEETLVDSLAPGGSKSIKLDGPGAIGVLDMKLGAEDLGQALRSTVLSIEFDGVQTVWCPAGDFFGTGYKICPYASWYTEVSADGTMSCYWPMPFQRSAKVTVHNLGKQTVAVDFMRVGTSRWQWDQRSMHFHAAWKQWSKIKTKTNTKARDHGAFDLNWIKIEGTGVYVGDTLTVFNGAGSWWGEGDEKIYVDGEKFPSHFGTGTEDYYGYAWCRPEYFEAPFHAQPHGKGNLEGGFSVNCRFRALDAIPFSKSLQFDMELWHWAPTRMNYAPTTIWYARSPATWNVKPMPAEAKRNIARVLEDVVQIKRIKGVMEGEVLTTKTLDGGRTQIQDFPQFNWSGNRQLHWLNAQVNDSLILEFASEKSGRFAIIAALTKANDYGIVKIAVNGLTVIESLDLYNPTVITNDISLGECQLRKGTNQLEITIIGSNPEAIKSHMFGLDYILIQQDK
jgi:hypothetical protein